MHPAASIIAFTTLSGFGFGLIAWLGLAGLTGLLLPAIAVASVAAGLFASLLHLGRPERFAKALTQWRTSWLSREALLALATLGLFGLAVVVPLPAGIGQALGLAAALLAVATVAATAMIYAQMRSVPRWRSPLTPLLFLLFAAAGGALATGAAAAPLLLLALGAGQVAAWVHGDGSLARSGTSLATATGLGPLGRLRLLAPPHTGGNYLLSEMVHVVGRRHRQKLRVIGLVLAVLLPAALVLAVADGPAVRLLAVLLHAAGALVLRWLFFAEAEHVVGLYYGRR